LTLHEGTPEEAGLDAERLELVKKRCREWLDDGTHPALVVLVARHGVIALHEAFGPVELDSVFPLASVAKPITATAVMLLVEDGLVGLTRPVQEYVPDFVGEGKEQVCVHHLLTHTSGMSDTDNVAYMQNKWDSSDVATPDGADPVVHKQRVLMMSAPLWKKPGEEMSYCNGGYVLLGEIVRAVTGTSLVEFARDRIFGPMGMRDTDYALPDAASSRVVTYPPGWRAEYGEFVPLMLACGSTTYSTAIDLAVFGQTFLNGGTYGDARLLSRPAVTEMTRNQIPGIPATFLGEQHAEASWGYGWTAAGSEKWTEWPVFPEGTFGHGGDSGAIMWVDPSNDLVGVFLAVSRWEPPQGLVSCVDLFANAVYAALE
jgi:CubicO group peptidase (beta-lactamase class C family)